MRSLTALIVATLASAACGEHRGTPTCEAWTTPLDERDGDRFRLHAVQPMEDGQVAVAVWDDNIPGIIDLDGNTLVDDLTDVAVDRLAFADGQLVVSGMVRDSTVALEATSWSFIADGAATTRTLPVPEGSSAAYTFPFDEYVVHAAVSEEPELHLAFGDEVGEGADWVLAPDVGEPWWRYLPTPGGVDLMWVESVDESADQVSALGILQLDTDGNEVSRWVMDVPVPSYQFGPLRDAAYALLSDEGLQIVDADGVRAETHWDWRDYDQAGVEFVALLHQDGVIWLVEHLDVAGDREEIWVRRFDMELVELAPGPTLVWSSWGTRDAPWPFRLHDGTLAVGMSRFLGYDEVTDDYIYRRDVARVRCTGARTPLAEVES